jgi:hypothetical protein
MLCDAGAMPVLMLMPRSRGGGATAGPCTGGAGVPDRGAGDHAEHGVPHGGDRHLGAGAGKLRGRGRQREHGQYSGTADVAAATLAGARVAAGAAGVPALRREPARSVPLHGGHGDHPVVAGCALRAPVTCSWCGRLLWRPTNWSVWARPPPPPPLLAPCLCCVVLVQTMIELGVRAHRRRRFCQLSGAFSLAAQTCCWTRRPPTPRRHPRARGATPSSEPCSAARTPPRWWGRGWATSRSWWSGRPPRTGQRPASPVRHRR